MTREPTGWDREHQAVRRGSYGASGGRYPTYAVARSGGSPSALDRGALRASRACWCSSSSASRSRSSGRGTCAHARSVGGVLEAELVADDVIAPVLPRDPDLLAGPMHGRSTTSVVDAVVRADVRSDPGIKRVKIWGTRRHRPVLERPASRSAWSPARRTTSRRPSRAGSRATSPTSRSPRTRASDALASKLFETYVPVRMRPDGPVVGVVEVYRDYYVIQAEIDRFAAPSRSRSASGCCRSTCCCSRSWWAPPGRCASRTSS